MEDAAAQVQRLGEGFRPHHELLHLQVIGCVRTAVQNIHHRQRQPTPAHAPQVLIQGQTSRQRRRAGGG